MMIETCGTTHAHDEDKLETFMERVKEQNVIVDGTIATEPDDIQVHIYVLCFFLS